MSKYDKYVKGGSINPFWLMEQEQIAMEERHMMDIDAILDSCIVQVPTELCRSTGNNYEEKFEFLKRHQDNPEDFKLAKQILGIFD